LEGSRECRSGIIRAELVVLLSRRPNVLFVCSKNKWRSPTVDAIDRNDDRISVSFSNSRWLLETRLRNAG